jgi:hypothetical protein
MMATIYSGAYLLLENASYYFVLRHLMADEEAAICNADYND